MEGGDNGAIFSLFIAGFAFFGALALSNRSMGLRVLLGGGRVGIMAVVAAVVAIQTLNVFVQTSFKGVADQDALSPEQRWDWATQWSLPKAETLRVIIPGLFGYRMDAESPTPEGGEYWGSVGQTPGWAENHNDKNWAESHPMSSPRFSGAGEYAGVLVVLVAIWALVEGLRKQGKAFDPGERKLILYWGIAALIAMLLGWGRYAPFYKFVYALPYFSTIRNPMKFMHPFHMALMILFAYGLQGLGRLYLQSAVAGAGSVMDQFKSWWAKSSGTFEKRWTWGCLAAFAASVLGWLMYSASRRDLAVFLSNNGFDPSDAEQIARYSVGEVGLYVVFLALSIAVVTLIVSGAFAGRRARWAMILLGLLVVVDLGRASKPWIKYYDYRDKYASNPILDILRDKPYEHRAVIWPRMLRQNRELMMIGNVYDVEWLQHQFPYYNIQSLDIPQEPRLPAEKAAYLTALQRSLNRLWELTNTRYILGVSGGLVDALNQQLDPQQRRFRLHTAFELYQNPGSIAIGARTNTTGPYALIEFTGHLPRARLYTQWQVSTNDQETLATLARPDFNPHATVLVSDSIKAPEPGSAIAAPGSVQITNYAPKRMVLAADAKAPSILLLNDKYDTGWKVSIDGKPAPLLRCNYIVRGVQVPAGQHSIEFRFEPPLTGLWISMSGLALGVLLCLALIVWPGRSDDDTLSAPAGPQSKPSPSKP